MWTSPRGSSNQGRAAGRTAGTEPFLLPGSIPVGAEIRYAAEVAVAGRDCLLVHAGSTLQCLGWQGDGIWSAHTVGAHRVLGVVRGRVGDRILVLTGESEVALIDATTGTTSWRWESPAGSNLSGAGSTLLLDSGSGETPRWLAFPSYSTVAWCFELPEGRSPRLVWSRDFGTSFDAGFGPVVIAADVLDRGSRQVVLSSRTGTGYRGGDAGSPETTELVLGREDGHLFQAVLDADTGATMTEVAYRPDPGPYPCARPYGLLQAESLSPGARPDIVLVSCQVEEYFSVTATDPALHRRWGSFVERDWPVDVRELRPQVTSLADVRGDGRPLLVVGLWQDGGWSTLLVDPLVGLDDGPVATIPGRYFWGCHDLDGDGVAEIVTSTESARRPGTWSTLEIWDARTMAPLASLPDSRILGSRDSELPPNVAFHADRLGSVPVVDGDRRTGVLAVRREPAETIWWSLAAEGPTTRTLLDGPADRVDYRAGVLLLSTTDGRVTRVGAPLRAESSVTVHGCRVEPLSWRLGDEPEVVIAHPSGTVSGWRGLATTAPSRRWHVRGALPALHVDRDGCARLAVADLASPTPAVRVLRRAGDEWQEAAVTPVAGIPHDMVAFGTEFRLAVSVRTGVHTASLVVLDSAGHVLWTDPQRGAHPNRPAAFPAGGRWWVAYDDHGVLTVADGDTGTDALVSDWTAAYTTPMFVEGTAAEDGVLVRVDGIHGIEALELSGARRWRTSDKLWEHFPGASALVRDRGGVKVASTRRSGSLEILEVASGATTATRHVGAPPPGHRPIVSLDVDGDGGDEVVVGTRDGHLRCLRADSGVTVLWDLDLGAAVEGIAVVGPADALELAVSTADGRVRFIGFRDHP